MRWFEYQNNERLLYSKLLIVPCNCLQIYFPQISRGNNSFALWAQLLRTQSQHPAPLTVHVPAGGAGQGGVVRGHADLTHWAVVLGAEDGACTGF